MKTFFACFADLLIFIILIKYVNSTHEFDKSQISSQKVDLSSELQKSSEFKYRERRGGTCNTEFQATIDPPLNKLDEEKNRISLQWMEGDKVIILADNGSDTSVWLIDATVPTSLVIQELNYINQNIVAVVVNPANKDNVVLIAADLKTLYIVMGGMVVKKKTFPNTLHLSLEDVELPYDLFHPTKPSYITVVSGNRFYYSTDLGYQWLEGPENVVRYQWGESDTLFYGIREDSNRYYHTLYRTDDLFKTQKPLQKYVYSFVFNKILFISKIDANDETNSSRMVWVSSDNGDHFAQARIPSAAPEQTYHVMAVTHSYAMLHFGNASSSGQLYISDSKFTSYTLSLHDCLLQGFYQVQSMRGVYIASVSVPDKISNIKTLITYNAGAEWNTISHVDCTTKECQLNLYLSDHLNRNVEEPQSSASATGLILAHGMVGSSLDLTTTSNLEMYMSNDGGYHWEKSPYPDSHFTLGNFGNLIVSISPDLIGDGCGPISSVRYKQGGCWGNVPASKFSGFNYCGFAMEPGASSLRTFLWGYHSDLANWEFYVIDFESALDRVCSSEDFEDFTPHVLTGCLLGFNETFQRVKSDSYCYISTTEAQLSSRKVNPCKCKKDNDFDCDFGYERKPGPNTTCFPIPGYEVAQHCLLGEDTYEFNELGLRLIPGDLCTNPDSILNKVNKSCSNWDRTVNDVVNFLQSHQNGSIAAGVVVLFILLFCTFLACFFVARMWLRRTKTKEPVAYMSLLNATEEEDNSLIESDLEKEKKDEDDCEPLKV